jgi:hypothetical protein
MNSITNQQRNPALQIAGIIQNYRKVLTRTGKPMASFTVGTFPAKCFDVVVDTAEYWAATGKTVLVAGHVSHHDETIELVAQSINLAPQGIGQTDAQTGFSQGAYAEISVQEQGPTRESSTITENLSGSVSNLKIVTTHSGRPMITFKIGNSSCKAFGELASAVQKAEGKHIEVSARLGRFQGVTEYAIEAVKTINGTAVDLRDSRTTSPVECINKNSDTSEAIAPPEKTESDPFEVLCKCVPGPGSHSSENVATTPDQQPLDKPDQDSSRVEQAEFSAAVEGGTSGPEPTEKRSSGMSASAIEAIVQQNVRSYRNADFFPDKHLEKLLRSGSRFASEAARRVLEERTREKAEDNRRSEDFVQVVAA